MGYRSDVAAMFYVSPTRLGDGEKDRTDAAKALLDIWWQTRMETCPDWMKNHFKSTNRGYVFEMDDVKWYESYTDVIWFNTLADAFEEEFIENGDLDGNSGLNMYFAYEYIRIGEDEDDTKIRRLGECEYRIQISRSISID